MNNDQEPTMQLITFFVNNQGLLQGLVIHDNQLDQITARGEYLSGLLLEKGYKPGMPILQQGSEKVEKEKENNKVNQRKIVISKKEGIIRILTEYIPDKSKDDRLIRAALDNVLGGQIRPTYVTKQKARELGYDWSHRIIPIAYLNRLLKNEFFKGFEVIELT